MSDLARIEFVDLAAQCAPLRDAIDAAVKRVLDAQQFIMGPEVEQLEAELAAYLEVEHAIGVSSGSDALLVALAALDIGPGDEVITTPLSFFATAGAVHRLGAKPVFVDVRRDTFNIDPDAVAQAVTDRTRAILPVHLFGQCADMTSLLAIARAHDLAIIEDAAQAIGGRQRGVPVGSLGDVACFSFHPTKNLGAAGDAGLVTSKSANIAARVRLLREHGAAPKDHHHLVGGNFRLDAIQAAILRAKLPALDGWNAARQRNAAAYDELLADLAVVTPRRRDDTESVFQQYTIRVDTPDGGSKRRDALRTELAGLGVATQVYYPVPLHLQPCFAELGYRSGTLPMAERAANSVLSLPVSPALGLDGVAEVARRLRLALRAVD
jgi:dTDP-4-amino-4,6-dideoxygalactose transaminase